MFTDSISDFLTRLRNANRARRGETVVHSSNMIKSIAELLVEKRFIAGFEEETSERKSANLIIRFLPERGVLNFKRVSKPGQRIYVGYKDIKKVLNGLGLAIVSTSQGIMSGEDARQKKLGGEYLCNIY